MSRLFTDTFNRANGAPGANWTLFTDGSGTAAISSNQLLLTYNVGNRNELITTTSALAAVADCKVSATRITGSGFDGGPIVRADTAADTLYYLDVSLTNTVQVYRRNAGTDNLVASSTVTVGANDVYRLEVTGSGATVTLKVFINDVQAGADISDTNASRITAAGQTGLFFWATNTFDDFLVDDFASSAALTGVAATTGVGTLTPSVVSEAILMGAMCQ